MIIKTYDYNQILGQKILVETEMTVRFRSMVSSFLNLPTLDVVSGDAVIVSDSYHLYVYVNSQWVDQGVYEIKNPSIDNLIQGLS